MKKQSVPFSDLLSLHKFREDGAIVFLLSDGKETRKLDEKQFARFAATEVRKGLTIISTTANPTDAILADLNDRGATIMSAHWHSTGIAKGLPAEEIAQKFAQLPEDVLRLVTVRKDIQVLKQQVNMRTALVEYRKAATLKLSAVERAAGSVVPKYLDDVRSELKAEAAEKETPLEKEIKKTAQKIDECRVLHDLLGTKDAWLSVAKIVAEVQDPRRFPMVSSLWHYAGLHGPVKRHKGVASDWNPKLKVSLWQLVDACLKRNVPTFRQPYDAMKAAELDAHDKKHPKCKTKEGHCGAMARRKLMKNFLKDFWIAVVK